MITQENIPYTNDEIKAMVKTIEELRKKYNDALERAKVYHTGGSISDAHITEVIFPELKKNNEEDIRKALIDYFDDANKSDENSLQNYGIQNHEAIAWLEKQYDKDKLIKEYEKYVNWLENQTEQSTDKIEPNPAWSEYDDEMLTWLCRIIHSQRLDKAITLKEESELGEWIDKWLNYTQPKQCEHLENNDNDEKIRQTLIDLVKCNERSGYKLLNNVSTDSMITWLEKQGFNEEQTNLSYFTLDDVLALQCCMETVKKVQEDEELYEKLNDLHSKVYDAYQLEKQGEQPINKVEPKFKVGDWVVTDYGRISRVVSVDKYGDGYTLDDGVYFSGSWCDMYHLWTIDDAKDGDVLATENFIFIFKNIDDGNGVHYYCQYEICKHENDNQFDIALPQSLMGRVGNSISHYSPATKEQRDLLFAKIKETGYEWIQEEKKLKKVESKMLDADRVVEWMEKHVIDWKGQELIKTFTPNSPAAKSYIVEQFKQDFGI